MSCPFVGTRIYWTIPTELADRVDLSATMICRSGAENSGYELLDTISSYYYDPSGIPTGFVTQYTDTTIGNGRDKWYLVVLKSPTTGYCSPFILTVKDLTPREARWIASLKSSTPPIIQRLMVDDHYRQGLVLSLQWFNLTPPVTGFSLETFPYSHEALLMWGAQITTLISRFLAVSIRDFSYSVPGGVTLAIDRGEKINNAIDKILTIYNDVLKPTKFDFVSGEDGLGTFQLPLSLGGMISRGVLNLLNVFQVSF